LGFAYKIFRGINTMIKLAINGYGRIGRNIVRAIVERSLEQEMEVVVINDLANLDVCAHLTKYDTTHGIFNAEVEASDGELIVNGKPIKFLSMPNPGDVRWSDYGVDLLLECAGKFKTHSSLTPHLEAGAPKVLASYPVGDADYMVVYGVNEEGLKDEHRIISNASCTTNCLAPVAKILDEAFGIEQGYMTTIHAYTNDQNLIDKAHSDMYRARAAAMSMVPSSTGAAGAVGKVLPALMGKLDGMAVRVPTVNVSLVDLVFTAAKDLTVDDVNAALKAGSKQLPAGVLEYNNKPLVSVDFNHNPASSIFDATQTRVNGRMVKIMAWYDNEWGFSNRMLDVARLLV
jgi:glyceraldehyde 3-phosphate dehydrogenase